MAESQRRKRSSLWNVFDQCNDNSGKAICKVCHQKLSYKSSTSNLKKHIDRKHQDIIISSESVTPAPCIFVEVDENGEKEIEMEAADPFKCSSAKISVKRDLSGNNETETVPDIVVLVQEDETQSSYKENTGIRKYSVAKKNQIRYNAPSTFQTNAEKKIRLSEIAHEKNIISAVEKHENSIMSAVEKLDSISKRVASGNSSSEKEDSFDHFGRYIASVLRDLPRNKAFLLQADVVSLIMKTTSDPPTEKPSNRTTVEQNNHSTEELSS